MKAVKETLFVLLAPLSVVLLVAVLSFGSASVAEAAPLGAAEGEVAVETQAIPTSLPYVEDVNPWGKGKVIATVVCYGGKGPFKLKAVDCKTGKKVKVTKYKTGVWTVVFKKRHTYKLSVKAKGGKYKSVKYGVC